MIRNGRFIMIDARRFMAATVLLGVALTSTGLWAVGREHEARRLRQDVCAARVRALKASAFLRDVVFPDDPCRALEIATR